MPRGARRGLILILILAAVAALVLWRTRPQPLAVEVAAVERGAVAATVANTRAGTVKAERRAKISPTISGRVQSLPVEQGDRVEAGQLLLELWNEDLQAELKVTRSQARAATARAEQACVLAEAAEREALRQRRLAERGVTSQESRDRAVSEARAKQAACRAARADATLAQDRIAAAEAALARTRLVAPFDGVVAELNAELGEIVSPSPPGIPTPPAVDLIDTGTLYVTAPIDEVDAPAVQLNMPARISLDALPGRSFAGHVSRIAPYVLDVEKQARTVDVEVSFDKPGEVPGLMPGYSADAEIILDRVADTLRVPTEAVLEGPRVLVLGADGILRDQPVKTGLRNWEHTQILEGLAPGEQVVLSVNRPGVEPGAEAVAQP